MAIEKKQIIKIENYLWKIPTSLRKDMQVPAYVFATEEMLEEILRGRSLEQLVNIAALPGVQKQAVGMPDIHEGYGFPIGGVAATNYPDGVISPGGIGYDINCGVRLLRSELTFGDIAKILQKLAKQLFLEIPSGVGHARSIKIGTTDLNGVLNNGVVELLKNEFADEIDLSYIESGGKLENADASVVSEHAKQRGRDQIGSMGAGNHFVEIDRIDEIFDEEIAKIFGIKKDQIVILIHTGSRGMGHQIATDYIKIAHQAMSKYGISVSDRELACVPLSSSEGKNYFNAMASAANFAWANRQMITWEIRKIWKNILGDSGGKLTTLYDVAHNIAKIEKGSENGIKQKLIIHRKGATRAFGPGDEELPAEYQKSGQPVIIPGSMGTISYLCAGMNESIIDTFRSCCHGAGRKLSRHQAKKVVLGSELKKDLEKQGVYVRAGSVADLAEEAPLAYKNIEDVVNVVSMAGIAKKISRLKPVAVIKG